MVAVLAVEADWFGSRCAPKFSWLWQETSDCGLLGEGCSTDWTAQRFCTL